MDEDPPNTNIEQETENPAPLQDTVWKWNTITLKFINATQAQLSGETLSYTFDENTLTGNVNTAGDFTINNDWSSLTFASYKSGGPRTFNNGDSSMIGSKWYLGEAALEFTNAHNVSLHGVTYNYNYDNDTKTGAITGGEWNIIGGFTINSDTITFSDYKESGLSLSYTKGNAPAPDGLSGTDWWWNTTSLHIEFISASKVLMWSTTGYYTIPFVYDYTYNAAAKTGSITNGKNKTNESKYDLGNFGISGTLLAFTQYGPYPHGADFTKQE
jgi:hypothetical protein